MDQAKGILMHALGCDADEAFGRMRHISQTQHVKLTEVARRVIEAGGLAVEGAGLGAQTSGEGTRTAGH